MASRRRRRSVAVLAAPAVVTGLNDVAVMGEAIEERGRHLGVAEHAGPFGEVEVGRHDDGRALVEPADQVEQQLAARLRKGEIAELVDDDEIDPHQPVGRAPLAVELRLDLEFVGKIDGVEEARLLAGPDNAPCNAYRNVTLPRAGSAYEDDVAFVVEEGAARKLLDQLAIDRRALEGELSEFLSERHFGNPQLIVDGSRLLGCDLRLEQGVDRSFHAMLALDAHRDDLIVGCPHTRELQVSQHLQDLRALGHGRASGMPTCDSTGDGGDLSASWRAQSATGGMLSFSRSGMATGATGVACWRRASTLRITSALAIPAASASAQAASTACNPSVRTAVSTFTICRSPSSLPDSLARTWSREAGKGQSLNGAPFLSAPGLRANTGT